MCRWIAYSGAPLSVGRILFEPKHSLIHQSLESFEGVEPTNGDGFGLGWYTPVSDEPGRYRSISPAWNDQNLFDLASHIESSIVFAHIRATTGTPVQHTNCHPFHHGRWLFMHNGSVAMESGLRRELMLRVAPELFDSILGSTDSELFFYVAMTEGLEQDPIAALARAAGLVESLAEGRGIECPVQGTFAVTDGETTWVVRYSTTHQSRSLYYSEDIATLRAMYPDTHLAAPVPDDARFIASEPFTTTLPGAWIKVPESTAIIVRAGQPVERLAFVPVPADAPQPA
jgi:glutamine amidotransferase